MVANNFYHWEKKRSENLHCQLSPSCSARIAKETTIKEKKTKFSKIKQGLYFTSHLPCHPSRSLPIKSEGQQILCSWNRIGNFHL